MNLIDEAVIIEIFGIRMYAFGLYVALGALCAVLVLGVVSSWLRLKKRHSRTDGAPFGALRADCFTACFLPAEPGTWFSDTLSYLASD